MKPPPPHNSYEASQISAHVTTITEHLQWRDNPHDPSPQGLVRFGVWTVPDGATFAIQQYGERRRLRPRSVRIIGSLLLHYQHDEKITQYAISGKGYMSARLLDPNNVRQSAIDGLQNIGQTMDPGLAASHQNEVMQALAYAATDPTMLQELQTKPPETE